MSTTATTSKLPQRNEIIQEPKERPQKQPEVPDKVNDSIQMGEKTIETEEVDSDLNEEVEIDDTGNIINEPAINLNKNITPLGIVLEGYGIEIYDDLMKDLEKLDVNMKNLSSLSNEDLELLGIKNPSIREKMLKDFACFPNQEHQLKYALREMGTVKYNQIVLTNVYSHLTNLKSALSTVLLKLHVKPVGNVLIDRRTYASTFVLKTLDEFYNTLISMEKSLKDLHKQEVPTKKKKTNYRNYLWKFLMFGMVTAGGTLMFMKYLKHRSI